MELISYLGVVRRKWWLILGVPVVLGMLVYMSSRSAPKQYEASATLLVNNLALTSPTAVPTATATADGTAVPQTQQNPGPIVSLNDMVPNEGIMETYTQLISRRVVVQAVIRALVLPYSEAELLSKIKAERVAGTQLITISAVDPSPTLAAAIANETSRAFISLNEEENGAGRLAIANEAEVPRSPISSGVVFTVILVVVAGFFLSSLLALLAEYLDDKVRTPSDVEVVTGLSTLAVVDRFGTQRGHPRELSAAEDYRELRTNLRAQAEEYELRTILIASPGRGEGRSRTVLNLGYMLAEAGESVILVDADLRQPALHKMIGTDNDRGLSNILADNDRLDLTLKSVDSRLDVLTAGPVPENPSIISFPRMWDLLIELRSRADYVILDSPGLLAVVDASDLARFVDGIILLVESGKTSADSLKSAMATLERSHTKIIGVVLNKGHSQRREQRSYRRNAQHPPLRPETALPSGEDGVDLPPRRDRTVRPAPTGTHTREQSALDSTGT